MNSKPIKSQQRSLLWLLLFISTLTLEVFSPLAQAQQGSEGNLKKLEDQQIQQFSLPKPSKQAPVYKPRPVRTKSYSQPQREQTVRNSERPRRSVRQFVPQPEEYSPAPVRVASPRRISYPTRSRQIQNNPEPVDTNETTNIAASSTAVNQYVMEFNRSPVVGNRFRLQGLYSSARLGFTRPRSWKLQSAKALIRFQHSPALLANRSNLTVLVNGTSIGSIPLNRTSSQVGQVLLNIPPQRLQDYNEISIVAQQHNSTNCREEDATDQTLWTEVLPDSKLIFNYQPQPIALDFARYPYPFFDNLSLDANQVAYLQPKQVSDAWLTGAARFSASLGRMADFRPLGTRVVKGLGDVEENERLVVIGTPEEQPALKSLVLPFKIAGNQILDGDRNALPADVGVLMVATTKDSGVPVLVVTGNGAEGVSKAVQFLSQSKDSKIGTGKAILVSKLTDVPTPSPRNWPRFIPEENSFKLSALKSPGNDKPFQDVTVRGSAAPPIEFDFRALPDDRFTRGSSMNLNYSYGPQVNPRTSAIEVLIDGVFIGGARLSDEGGAIRQNLNVNLPENLIKPTSKIQVFFRLNPKEPGTCGKVTDQQLTGTVHADTSFNLKRENSVTLPNLKLLQVGYPFASPQDLSTTAIVVPDSPSATDLATLLKFSERLGRLSQADSVKLRAYTAGTFPAEEKDKANLVGIGVRDKFPFPEVFQAGNFKLDSLFARQRDGASIQTLPDGEGVIKQVISPWKGDRVLLALTAQTETGLDQVRQLLTKDPWFFQIQGDTTLISSNQTDASAYDPDAYNLEFLENAPKSRIENTSPLSKVSRWFQEHWFVLPTAIVVLALILYGISQLYIKRVGDDK